MKIFHSATQRVIASFLGLSCSFLTCAVLAGCGGGDNNQTSGSGAGGASAASSGSGNTSTSNAASSGAGGSSSGHIKTVFLILMENKVWSEIKGSADAPYVNGTLLPQASVAESYKGANDGNLHPSEPNYIWLEAGDNLGITNDNDPSSNHRPETDHLVTLLETAGVTWMSYQEDISGDVCPLTGVNHYATKHNPMVFFDDVTNTNDPNAPRCLQHMRPFIDTGTSSGNLEADLAAGTVAAYNFITPNQCNDMHSACAPQNNVVKQGDDWLAAWIPKIQASPAYQDGGAIFITWDEGELTASCILANCPIGMFVISPLAKGGGYSNMTAYDHSSTLKSMQEIFGVTPLLRGAANAAVNDLADFFTVPLAP